MDAEHAAHLERIRANFTKDLAVKYETGQIEHGGNLWDKPGMLEHAIEEAIDMVVYLYTLKEQQERHR